ncbi:NAD(P)/FAD-dependent oxidoreductase [Planococcus sp. APC 4015]|nr:NAD(P)/FAD-dependent oxidoreductase [Planococcus sp. APC 4015]
MADEYDVAVIGGGPAGTSAALRAAGLGARVVLLEASDRFGGTCVNTGCVPTRALARAARLMRDIRGARAFGIRVDEPALDWPAAVARVQERVEAVRDSKSDEQRLVDAGVTIVREGLARFEDAHTIAVASGRRVSATSTIICVGGHSRLLPIPGAELALVPEHLLTVPALPDRVAIIGGGNTGTQVATILDSFGVDVSLFDVAPRILMTSDAGVAEAITAEYTTHGITVRTGIAGVDGLEQTDDGAIALTWRDGDDTRTESFGAVIMATGWPGAIADIGLEDAGVEVSGSYIPVDGDFRTSASHIFAVGDVNGQSMLVQAARFEAEAAAENAVLGVDHRTPHHLLPVGAFTDPDFAGVGLTEEEARERMPDCLVAVAQYSDLERALIDDRAVGFLKLICDSRRSLIVGAHAVGENAVEVIQAVTTAMAAGIDVATLAKVKFAYPTYSAVIGNAARLLLDDAAESG